MATDKDKENESAAASVDPNAPETPRSRRAVTETEAPTPRADETIPGGRYINADGVYVNANGQFIDKSGNLVDEPVKARK